MLRTLISTTVLFVLAFGSGCSGTTGSVQGGASPTEAYKELYAAVKRRDTEGIKKNLTKKTIEFGQMASARSGTPIEQVLENGFSESTFSPTLPTIRDERINGNMGAIEVWNSQRSEWEDMPFMLEDGAWKLAVGELFSGSFRSPGKGRGELEKEAANAMAPPPTPAVANSNVNRRMPKPIDIPIPTPSNK